MHTYTRTYMHTYMRTYMHTYIHTYIRVCVYYIITIYKCKINSSGACATAPFQLSVTPTLRLGYNSPAPLQLRYVYSSAVSLCYSSPLQLPYSSVTTFRYGSVAYTAKVQLSVTALRETCP